MEAQQQKDEKYDTRVEVLRRSYAAGEYLDQFTTVPAEPAEVTLNRRPKGIENDRYVEGKNPIFRVEP